MHDFCYLIESLVFHAVKQFHDRNHFISAEDKHNLIVVLFSRRLCFPEEVYNMATLLLLIMTHALPQLLSTVPNSHFPELFKVLIIYSKL